MNAFFTRFEELLKPGRHAKWKEVNVYAELPGWQRFRPAQAWIERTKPIESASSLQNDFQCFLAASGRTALPGAARERLFQDFRVWRKTQAKRSAE